MWPFYLKNFLNFVTLQPYKNIEMTKEQIIQTFDPSQPGLADATIFGLPFSAEQSEVIIIPVPWEVTVSYGAGASEGTPSMRNRVSLMNEKSHWPSAPRR